MPEIRPFRPHAAFHALAVALAVALVTHSAPVAAETRSVDRSFDAATVRNLDIENLAGRFAVVAATGSAIRIQATVHAEASAGESGAALADALRIDFQENGDRLVVKALYPLAAHRRYHYPADEKGQREKKSWLESWLSGSRSTLRYLDHEVTVVSSPNGDAASLWVDFTVEVPSGVALKARNAVGRVSSTDVDADQSLDTAMGDIDVGGGRGALRLDTGSGDVAVADHDGDVLADTGSGDVHFSKVSGGKLAADTGSGDVTFDQARGELLAADTGSGDVHLLDCEGALDADTGSGEIRGRGLKLGAKLRADTGSGDVLLAGDFSAVADLYIDTGSGDVVLDVDGSPSVHLVVSTGSGDVVVDLPNAHVRTTKGNFVADLGDANGKARIETGSGDVKIVGR